MSNTISCPHCQTVVQHNPSMAGSVVRCPKCDGQFQVPSTVSPLVDPTRSRYGTADTAQRGSHGTISNRRILRRRQQATGRVRWLGFLDLQFEKYLTPMIVRATWCVVLILAATNIPVVLYFVLRPETSNAGQINRQVSVQTPGTPSSTEPSQPRSSGESQDAGRPNSGREVQDAGWEVGVSTGRIEGAMNVARKGLAMLSWIVGPILLILWVRVLLETVIVVFNIANTLTSIDDRLKAQEAQ